MSNRNATTSAKCGRCHAPEVVADDDVQSCLNCGAFHSRQHQPGVMLNRATAAGAPRFNGVKGPGTILFFDATPIIGKAGTAFTLGIELIQVA